ncbi:hypothetical protein BKA69DRAFT_1043355 [Paraphysoderma sedebokerense]|nr:hypothetical protein BKA69DRAFT_1043355 [Paraphysoderma sedebokerense]
MGVGVSAGIALSVILFRKRTWPIAFSTGIGTGMAYEQCQSMFDPNVRLDMMRVAAVQKKENSTKA